MLDGTLVTDAPFTQPPRTGRMMLLAAVLSAVALAGCASRSQRAPVADHSNASSSSGAQAAARGTYVVRAGDTLYKIAQSHGMEPARLAQLNNISDPTQLAIGQVLRLDANTSAPQHPGSSTAVATPVQTKPAGGTAAPAPEAAAGASAPVDTSASRASDAGLVSWGWPADGKIIQGFNSNTKGIDIEGAIGAPVVAAAGGKVMYAGNGVRGLGNLILLGHSNGFITAYAHNQSLLVKTGETVKKGAKIATIGQSDTTSPRLHFEIRRRGTPVNPLSYLPSR
ncbi:peptidoglycan DD-metalloendopeptidase family protein [uncultured Castellaniella sp.]|uniref:peptidoglycan DD-metalloendopeptidase family protein n=1 Tax=uncultured Castellaniella sp. TaxID=647907 RepID=UPI00262B4001|nr:peptidoglycan DD-metalloendopeptidase family protein [uncultured Castellaniella sp.]